MRQRVETVAVLRAQQHQCADAWLKAARFGGERRAFAGRTVGGTDENIGGCRGERAGKGGGIGDEMRFGAGGAGSAREACGQQRPVVEDQYTHAFECGVRSGAGRRFGDLQRQVDAEDRALAAFAFDLDGPPMASTRRRVIARPRPVPSYWRAWD